MGLNSLKQTILYTRYIYIYIYVYVYVFEGPFRHEIKRWQKRALKYIHII
jgi:hypothetical protein